MRPIWGNLVARWNFQVTLKWNGLYYICWYSLNYDNFAIESFEKYRAQTIHIHMYYVVKRYITSPVYSPHERFFLFYATLPLEKSLRRKTGVLSSISRLLFCQGSLINLKALIYTSFFSLRTSFQLQDQEFGIKLLSKIGEKASTSAISN